MKIKVDAYKCERCRHVWVSRQGNKDKPRVCPKCKSPYYDIPRKKKRNKKRKFK